MDAQKTLPLITLIGPTASGKTAAALQLAQDVPIEIICADSRTIYKGMDIGTAKPTMVEQAIAPHHMLDVVSPQQHFSAAKFKVAANQLIQEIRARGRVPVLVGGSGLYVDAVLFDFSFIATPVDAAQRQRLEQLSVAELQQKIIAKKIPMPTNQQNKRHLIRALETGGKKATKKPLRSDAMVFGIDVPNTDLKQRIQLRVRAMFDDGVLAEAYQLAEKYGWDAPGMRAPAYKIARLVASGTYNDTQAMQALAKLDYQLARRQKTWFRRNKSIRWIPFTDDVAGVIKTAIQQQ